MKFCELVMFFMEENELQGKDVFLETLTHSKWAEYRQWYIDVDEIVNQGLRFILDREVPCGLCIELFSKSLRKFYLIENKVITECGEDFKEPSPTKNYKIMTALEIFEIYGGTSLYIVQDKGIYYIYGYPGGKFLQY